MIEVIMATTVITEDLKHSLEQYLKKHRKIDLVNVYLYYVQQRYEVHPVIFLKGKKIYLTEDEILKELEAQGQLWRETEVKITLGQPTVNEQTKKIYICPFCGKVFGDNTHPNPQDAIYDWVSKCPENKEKVGGLKVKRFYVSDDPEMIKNYITERKATIKKVAYSSVLSGKLFNSKTGVIDDFRRNQLRAISLAEVQNQNKFEIADNFLEFIHKHLQEERITSFVEALAQDSRFEQYVNQWFDEEEQQSNNS
ncbi:MAG: hypothetical protein K0S74_738 [Chlamydiales bacterium]|jgi:hypothetical protein|nr:hypothetical protein [Chlamydiales bacterium]